MDGHTRGLELVNGVNGIEVLVDGSADDSGVVTLKYENQRITVTAGEVGAKTITLTYTTKVCDPCIFANNTVKAAFKNTISTTDMIIGRLSTEGRSASAESTANVSATVLTKKAPVYDYASGMMKWTVEVDAAGLPMSNVVLTDDLPEGLTYEKDSLKTAPEIHDASASASGQRLTIHLGKVTEKTVVTFDTEVDPEALGFSGDSPVVVNNTIRMNGEADGVEFAEVSHSVRQNFSNHGLVKSSMVDNQQEFIQYEVLINPYHLALPEDPLLVDTLDKRLQLDTDTLHLYKANLTGTTAASKDQKPGYTKSELVQQLKITDFDPDANSFTVRLPVSANSRDAYVLTYRADIIDHQAGGYSNSVRFAGGSVLLGGNKNNSASVGGGGGGGGGGVAARKATIAIVKTDSETKTPLPGVFFLLYQWDSDSNTRGLPFAQGKTDAQGKLAFRVKPGGVYELVETESIPGYHSKFSWANLPDDIKKTDSGLLITAGAAKSELKLELTNEAYTTDIAFRLVNESGIPMTGAKVRIFTSDPAGQPDLSPFREATVSADGTVRFSGIRRGAKYYIQRPDGGIMPVDVPAQVNGEPKVTLPNGTMATLNADYQATGTTDPDQQWELTVNIAISGGTTPLAGATIGLYADAACQTLIKTEVSDQNGTIIFSGLIKGQSYWLKETKAPTGYQLNGNVYEGTEGDFKVTLENAPSPVNPGDPGSPGKPDDPGDPDDPGKSDNPDDSGNHDKPGRPDDPNSGKPDDPGAPDKPENSDKPDNFGKSGNSGDSGSPDDAGSERRSASAPNNPKTGDNTQPWIVVTLLSGIVLIVMTLYHFRGQRKREEA